MKSNIMPNRHFIECACSNPEHQLIFDYYLDTKLGLDDITIYIRTKNDLGFCRKIKKAIKYLFGNEELIISDSVLITEKNVKDLKSFVFELEELYE